jgi:hypothetical protein
MEREPCPPPSFEELVDLLEKLSDDELEKLAEIARSLLKDRASDDPDTTDSMRHSKVIGP